MRIGLISDTHGLLRPEAVAYLEGCECILHAGDIGNAQLLERLAAIAPVHAVRGNNDREGWADTIPESEWIELGGVTIHMLHDLAMLDVEPRAAGIDVIVSGHSHRPSVREVDGVLYVNPGSAGPRRFSLPVSAGELIIGDARVQARCRTLLPG